MPHPIFVAVLLAGVQCQAQPQPSALPAAAEPTPLAGPTVRVAEQRTTLIALDFMGKLKELESFPEVAAISLLKLDPDAAKRAQDVIAQRAALLDRLLMQNIELALALYSAQQAEDRAESGVLLLQAAEKLTPYFERGPLLTELQRVLPKEAAAELSRLVNEYRDAAIEPAVREARERGERPRRAALLYQQHLRELGGEVRRSYERQLAAAAAELERVIGLLELRPEQEQKVRRLVSDFAQRTLGKATAADRRKLFVDVMKELDAGQRRKLVGEYLDGASSPR